jgi:hypothetical protein
MLPFLFFAEIRIGDGGNTFLKNAGNHLQDNMASQPWRSHKHFHHRKSLIFQVVKFYGGGNAMESLTNFISTQKMEAIFSSETLVTTYKTTWHHNLEDHIHIFTVARTSNFRELNSMGRQYYGEFD